jgi:DNA polymerase-1
MKIKPYTGRRTTDKKVLENLLPNPFIEELFRYRKLAKERGTYVDSIATWENGILLPGHICDDGKVHASLALYKTRTGRLASSDPNIQNIPRNPLIRGQFVAPPGRRLLEVDLNQAELRFLALLSGDEYLCHIYLTEGMSLHDEVRAKIWGHPKDYSPVMLAQQLQKFALTPETRFDENGKDLLVAEQKMRAKNVNFGTVYGITAAGLAEQCDCTVKEAQEMLDAWFKTFPKAKEYIDACKMAPFEGKNLVTRFGRKKRPGIVSQERARDIQNEFANFAEQSPASDCTVHAGIALKDQLRDQFDIYACNLIHDAILFDCPDDDQICLEAAKIIVAKMEEVPKKWGYTKIPFKAEAKQGYRWGSLKDVKFDKAA